MAFSICMKLSLIIPFRFVLLFLICRHLYFPVDQICQSSCSSDPLRFWFV